MERECVWCKRPLRSDNPGKLCVNCAHKLKDVLIDLPGVLDAEDVAELLHLKDAETVRRKHRRGELPDCIPGQKKKLWFKDVIMAYLKYGQSFPAASMEKIQAVIRALELGVPIDRLTSYGLDPDKLIDEFGYPRDDKDQPQKRQG